MNKTQPIPIPIVSPQVYIDTVVNGPPILPIERIKLYSSEEWESFVHEWAYGLCSKYCQVERCAGPGDMGRDIIAYPNDSNFAIWENFQCKHYNHPLRPGDIWIELGKIVYYSFIEEFTYPSKYWFVAPQGVGTLLGKLLKKPDELRKKLIENWDEHCRSQISISVNIKLTSQLQAYVDGLDFSIFSYLPPLKLIDEHRSTPYHLVRFGGALPERPTCPSPPATPAPNEVAYLRKLFDAYGDHLKRDVHGHSDIESDQNLRDHYVDSRFEFYSAESLRSFSRDTLPEGAYEELQEEVYDGVRDVIRSEQEDGYRRVIAVVTAAKNLQLTSHALLPRLQVRDRGGICHQLANDRDNVKWVK